MTTPSTSLSIGRAVAILIVLTHGFALASTETYRYFRFTQTALRGGGSENSIQLSEFEMRFEGAAIPGATATNPGGDNPGAGEAPDKAVDGLLNTKWLDFNKAPLVLDFGAAVTADGYRFGTANDADDRDPVSWTLEGSNNNVDWTLLQTITNHPTTTVREVYEQEFLFCPPPTIIAFEPDFGQDQILENGSSVDLYYDTLDADTLAIDNSVGAVTPDFGTATVTPPNDADTTYTLTATNAVDSATASATIRTVTQGSATFRYIRFTPIRLREVLPGQPEANSIQITEFEFLNGVTPVVPVGATNPGGDTPGAEGVGNLIDGDFTNKWLDFNKSNVIFDFGSSTTIDAYLFTTGGDAPERDPVAWVLDGSDDEVNWTIIDAVTVEQGDPNTDFNFLPPLARQATTQDIPIPTSFAVPEPLINSFQVAPGISLNGTTVDLDFATSFAATLEIDNGVGAATPDSGTESVTPPNNADTTYTLTAENALSQQDTATVTARTVVAGSASYQFVRFTPLRLAEELPGFNPASSIQLAEFEFLNSGVPLDLATLGATATNPGGDNPVGGAEDAPMVIDGDTGTKWLDFNKSVLVIDFGSQQTFDAYRWTTANDFPERDPVAWTLEGSNDGSSWALIDNANENRSNPAEDVNFFHGLGRLQSTPDIPVPDASSLLPVISLFTGDAPSLASGEPLVLRWEVAGATTVEIDNSIGTVAASGSTVLNPVSDTTWTLSASSAVGTVTAQFSTVIITPSNNVICYEGFDSAGPELILLGDAAVVNDFANIPNPGDLDRLRLTPDSGDANGTAWFAKRQDCSTGFEAILALQFISGGPGADGISFMVQNHPQGTGVEPDGANEEGLSTNALNIKFDSFQNPAPATDPSGAFVQVKNGTTVLAEADLTDFPGITIDGTDPLTLTQDDFNALPYEVRIAYEPGDLDVYFDNVLVIDSVNVNLGTIGAVDGSGKGYVGFSSRTGSLAENHDVTRWIFIPGPPPPPVDITAFSTNLGGGTATFTFASRDTRTYRVTASTDGTAFTPVATGIAGAAEVGETTTTPLSITTPGIQLFRVEVENPLKTP